MRRRGGRRECGESCGFLNYKINFENLKCSCKTSIVYYSKAEGWREARRYGGVFSIFFNHKFTFKCVFRVWVEANDERNLEKKMASVIKFYKSIRWNNFWLVNTKTFVIGHNTVIRAISSSVLLDNQTKKKTRRQ